MIRIVCYELNGDAFGIRLLFQVQKKKIYIYRHLKMAD